MSNITDNKSNKANPDDLSKMIATWFESVKNQGFIPNAYFESESEEESDDYETDTESETDDDDDTNNRILTSKKNNSSADCNINSNIDLYYKTDTFVVEDPFIEVKDEHIDYIDDSSTDDAQMIHLKNGFILCGKFRKKRRCGFGSLTGASLERKGIKSIWGKYKAGVLEGAGKVHLMDECETVLHGNFLSGKLHGLVRGLSFKENQLTFIGRFKKGYPTANCWKAVLPGRSWLYGTLDLNFKCSGDNNAFIYPDLNTVLLGSIQDDQIIKAYESSITGFAMKGGILYLNFHHISGPEFRFWPSTLQKVRCPWLQEDPYERKTVYSGLSAMGEGAGDGLFLHKDVSAGTMVSFYNGIRIMPGEIPPFRSDSYQIFLDWRPTNIQNNDREYLDIPPECVSLKNYRASLGHKINHSFQPNCIWDQIIHPTFGRIPSIITLMDLKAGTELTCHYMIDMQEASGIDHLQWYVDLWEKMTSSVEDRTVERIAGEDSNSRVLSNNG